MLFPLHLLDSQWILFLVCQTLGSSQYFPEWSIEWSSSGWTHPRCPNPPTPHNGRHYRRTASNLLLEHQVLCIFGVWFKMPVGNILGFCLYQLPPTLVAVPQDHFPSGLPTEAGLSPGDFHLTSNSPQSLWCHFRPFFLTAPTVQLHRVSAFSASKLQPQEPHRFQVFAN